MYVGPQLLEYLVGTSNFAKLCQLLFLSLFSVGLISSFQYVYVDDHPELLGEAVLRSTLLVNGNLA